MPVRTATAPVGQGFAQAVSPTGDSLAMPDSDGQPVVYNLATLAQAIGVKTGQTPLAVAFSADGKALAVASQGKVGRLSVVDLATNVEAVGRDLEWPAGARLAISFESGMILAGSPQSTSLIDAATGDSRFLGEVGPGGLAGPLCFSPAGDLAAWSAQTGVQVSEVASGRPVASLAFEARRAGCTALAISPDGRLLAQGCGLADVALWDIAEGRPLGQFVGHGGTVRCLSFSGDSSLLASASADGTALVWDMAPFRPAGAATAPADAKELEALWIQLADDDAARAYRAVNALAEMPGQAVTLLRERLKPAEAIRPEAEVRIKALIADLGDSKYAVRRRAYRELEGQLDSAAPLLQQAFKTSDDPEVRTALEKLLQSAKTAVPGLLLRPVRAVTVLERVGSRRALTAAERAVSASAVAVLDALAKGVDARQTAAAKAALARLAAFSGLRRP